MKVLSCGEKIKRLREKSGMTQRQLAERLGIGKSTVALYETKDRIPSALVLMKAAAYFHVSTDYLLGLEKEKRADLSGLTDNDIDIIERLIESMREKNKQIKKC